MPLEQIAAFAWHTVDTLFDVFDAPKPVRVGLAAIGLGWSVYFLAKYTMEAVGRETISRRTFINPH